MRRKRRRVAAARQLQCERCQRVYCPESTQHECAYREFVATGEGTLYECREYEAPYWELMCA